MEKVKVYQIGVSGIGRFGFEKLVDISKEFEEVEICGLCGRDFDAVERAERFAEANGIEMETFEHVEKMYEEARSGKDMDENVMVYDAGPMEKRSDNIYRSMQNDFFHLSERPPSMNRDEHLREKRLSEEGRAMWKCDFVEREHPVLKKAVKLLEGKEVGEIEVFRESSVGVEKALNNFSRLDVKGGDILDRMVNEVFVLDLLEAAASEAELELEEARARNFQPRSVDSENFMDIYGGKSESLSYETATSMTKAEFSSGNAEIKLHSSWMGLSEEAMLISQQVEQELSHRLFERDTAMLRDSAYVREEARFFVVRGEKELVGDLLHGRLFDLEKGEEIEPPEYLHDPLHRVIEKAVFSAMGREAGMITGKEIDVFMGGIFDVKESIDTGKDYFGELENAQQKLEGLVVEDSKPFEFENYEVAG
ncbi:MAG: hypothetical protein ABEJ56_02095 [Candidatus Nanohaloarchaea archaeon]